MTIPETVTRREIEANGWSRMDMGVRDDGRITILDLANTARAAS